MAEISELVQRIRDLRVIHAAAIDRERAANITRAEAVTLRDNVEFDLRNAEADLLVATGREDWRVGEHNR